jgi:hypothetical protein
MTSRKSRLPAAAVLSVAAASLSTTADAFENLSFDMAQHAALGSDLAAGAAPNEQVMSTSRFSQTMQSLVETQLAGKTTIENSVALTQQYMTAARDANGAISCLNRVLAGGSRDELKKAVDTMTSLEISVNGSLVTDSALQADHAMLLAMKEALSAYVNALNSATIAFQQGVLKQPAALTDAYAYVQSIADRPLPPLDSNALR